MMTKINTAALASATDGYRRVSPARARELIGTGRNRLPSDKVTLIEDDGVVYAADRGTVGAITYVVLTYQSGPGVGEFNVCVPEGAPFDHAYVKPGSVA